MKAYINKAVSTYKGIFKAPPNHVPCNAEPDGALCGNGDIGVVLGGTSECLQFYLSKNDVWRAAPLYDTQNKNGMKAIGNLSITIKALENADFNAVQHINNATITTSIHNGNYSIQTQSYVLRKKNLFVNKITCIGESTKISISLNVSDDPLAVCEQIVKENTAQIIKKYESPDLDWPCKVSAKTVVLGKDAMSFTINTGETATIVTAIYTNQDSESYLLMCENDIAEITESTVDQYKCCHDKWWGDFWGSSGICIESEPEVEKYWYASHYIMACCCEKGKFAPGIFGNWITTNTPHWAADYHLNYNHQAPWWGVYSSNKVGLSEPYDTPILQFIPESKKAAREKLGCRGLYTMVGCGPKGLKTANIVATYGNNDASFWGQKSNASYAAINMIMRYYSTYDDEYAQNIAFPYLKEVVAFWEDYLKFEDGRYVDYNDCIHECYHAAKGTLDWIPDDEDNYSDDFNPILMLGFLRTILKCIVDMGKKYGCEAEKLEKWEHMKSHLSEFPTMERNNKTVFRLTERGMAWNDANSLGIQHIFPAGAIGLSSPKELLVIAHNTYEEMARWEDYNAFPTFYTAGARIGYNPDIIIEKMKNQFIKHGFDNLFIYYGGGGIECCSAVPSCINEMLMQSHEGIIRFFPVWNKQKDARFYNLRAYGAFVVSATLNDYEVCDVTLLSEKGNTCVIQSPWKDGLVVYCDGEIIPVDISGDVYTFKTTSNSTYSLHKK